MKRNVNQIEKNVVDSFRMVKQDIYGLYEQVQMAAKAADNVPNKKAIESAIAKNKKTIEEVKSELFELSLRIDQILLKKTSAPKTRTITKTKVVRKVVRPKKKYVGAKTSDKMHESKCMFAKNIDRKNKVVFKTRNQALKKGYKLCNACA